MGDTMWNRMTPLVMAAGVWFALGSVGACAAANGGEEGLPRVLFAQDYEGFPLGPAKLQPSEPGLDGPNVPKGDCVVADDTWTGNKSSFAVADTHSVGGKALEVDVNSYAQFCIGGPLVVEPGKYYRVKATYASQGPKKVWIAVRRGPDPYTGFVVIEENANEEWKTIDYTVKTDKGDTSLVIVSVLGQGSFWLGDLLVEEVAPPADAASGKIEAPPLVGNMIQNSSFELGLDGWLFRDEAFFQKTPVQGQARSDDGVGHSGKRSLLLTGNVSASAAYQPVAYGQTYTVTAMVKADFPNARCSMALLGPNDTHRQFAVSEGTWSQVTFAHVFQTPLGLVTAWKGATLHVAANVPEGKHLWFDDISFQAGTNTVYKPRGDKEFGMASRSPRNLIVAGEPIELEVRASVWVGDGQSAPTSVSTPLERFDETGKRVQRYPALKLGLEAARDVGNSSNRLASYSGRLTLTDLPVGYWRMGTQSGSGQANEGEMLISCVPRLPDDTAFSWQTGTHGHVPAYEKAGIRWYRMHDASIKTKWHFLEPEKGKWNWEPADKEMDWYLQKGDIQVRILGLLDGLPKWRSKTGQGEGSVMGYPDQDFADWANYVKQVVSHFKGRIDAWEIMNEAVFAKDIPGGVSNPEWYVELQKVAYEAAKDANPEAFIVGGGGAGAAVKGDRWVDAAIKAGLFKYCDAFSYHGYGRCTSQILGGIQPLIAFTDWVKEGMQSTAGRVMPIWDTEVGVTIPVSSKKFWFPPRDVVSDDASIITRQALVCLLAEKNTGVDKTFLYHGFDCRTYGPGGLWIFPDINEQFTPAPVAIAVFSSVTEGLVPDGFEAPAKNVSVVKFRTPAGAAEQRTVWGVWTLKDKAPVTMAVSSDAQIKVLGMYGRELKFKKSKGAVIVEAGPLPLYVIEVK